MKIQTLREFLRVYATLFILVIMTPLSLSAQPFKEKPKYIIEQIYLEGNEKTRAKVIRERLLFKIGDAYDESQLESSRFQLMMTGFFSDVDFKIRRGSKPGTVHITVKIVERGTFGVNSLTLGSSKVSPFWGGIDVGDRNFLGYGVTFSGAMAFGKSQQGFRLRFKNPGFAGSSILFSSEVLFNNARDFFSGLHGTFVNGEKKDYAVVEYRRLGAILGIGFRLTSFTNMFIDYHFEGIEATVPQLVTEVVPIKIDDKPIEYTRKLAIDIKNGRSYLSAFALTLLRDDTNHPFIPEKGSRFKVHFELGTKIIGSDYGYSKFTINYDHYWLLPWNHTIGLHLFGGIIIGDTPFFNKFFVGDLIEFVPARELELNFSNRRSPNWLKSTLNEKYYEDLATKIGFSYAFPLYKGGDNLYKVDFFISFSLVAMTSQKELDYFTVTDVNSFPVDLTMDFGFRFDTSVGIFALSFGNLIGLIDF